MYQLSAGFFKLLLNLISSLKNAVNGINMNNLTIDELKEKAETGNSEAQLELAEWF